MKVEQIIWHGNGEEPGTSPGLQDADLVYIFGSPDCLRNTRNLQRIRQLYPNALYAGCSTAGEISGAQVLENTVISTAVRFSGTNVQIHYEALESAGDSHAVGKKLVGQISGLNLRHIFVLSDGITVNGSELVRGIFENLPAAVPVTGGLAADGDRFQHTYVLGPNGPQEKLVSAVAFYGSEQALQIKYGSMGGWDPFGPERIVTRANGSVVYQLDGKPVLALYKKYLGEHAAALPASALLFPLSVRNSATDEYVVRTVLSIDDAAQSMRFAGDIAEGSRVRLMKANFERLIDGATAAAENTHGPDSPGENLAMLISCVGRKLVLKQRIDEEVLAVQASLGANAILSGFYSYGEISPLNGFDQCRLHNQTMTITRYVEPPVAT